MLQMAQDMLKVLQDRFRTTLRVMADLAESVGVPPAFTSMLAGRERADVVADESWTTPVREPVPPPPAPEPSASAEPEAEEEPRRASRKRGLGAGSELSEKIRALKVDDEVKGSTYLARILWSLGVAELEGTGALRPADMARMIMSRSAVSLEPPNVARYIRRSKPTCIKVARSEGSSNFYELNDEGRAIFDELFRTKK